MSVRIRASFCLGLIFISCFLGSAQTRQSKAFAKLAEKLFPNVVIVKGRNIECKNLKGKQDGFGLVIGERENSVFIATAYHLVCGMNPEIFVRFKWTSQDQSAELIGEDSDKDMAILKVVKPPDFRYKKACLMRRSVEFDDPVKIIGIEGKWKKQTSDQGGAIVAKDYWPSEDIIESTIKVQTGSSGGPGYTSQGVFGIVRQSATNSRFIDIRDFESLAKRKGIPFDLTNYRGGSKKTKPLEINRCSRVLRPGKELKLKWKDPEWTSEKKYTVKLSASGFDQELETDFKSNRSNGLSINGKFSSELDSILWKTGEKEVVGSIRVISKNAQGKIIDADNREITVKKRLTDLEKSLPWTIPAAAAVVSGIGYLLGWFDGPDSQGLENTPAPPQDK